MERSRLNDFDATIVQKRNGWHVTLAEGPKIHFEKGGYRTFGTAHNAATTRARTLREKLGPRKFTDEEKRRDHIALVAAAGQAGVEFD